MKSQNISCFVLLSLMLFSFQCKYVVFTDLNNNATQTDWLDKTSNNILNICTKDDQIKSIGSSLSQNFIQWERVYSLSKSSLVHVYFEYQISGVWNNYELSVFANNLLAHQEIISLNDVERDCNQKFKYESYVYFVLNQFFDSLKLEVKVNQINIGLYIQNIVLCQKTQVGRNWVVPIYDYILTCTQGSGLKYIQYFCKCQDAQVYKDRTCQSTCGQNYVYELSTNNCYFKRYCSNCVSNIQTLVCDAGYLKLVGSDISTSECVSSCPGRYYADTPTQTCLDYSQYLSTSQNNGYPVNHYYFYEQNAEYFHFFKSNDFMVQVASTPTKIKERGFIYFDNKFVVGSFTTFQTQEIQIFQVVQNSQYKLRFRATAYFLDFYPTKVEFYVNGVLQPTGTIAPTTTNLQKDSQDYYVKFDVEWIRTEVYPVTQNIFKFIVEQPLQGGDYKGYFYIDDIHVFQFECLTGCNSCYTYQFCTPCLNPANKNPADCTCVSGYKMKNDVCISCPTYCTTCDVAGVCNNCKTTTLRTNSPACDTCPSNYYVKANTENCQPCITGCKVCSNDTSCTQCQSGYFRNSSNICITLCPNGQFNDSSNINDPKCTICDNNCLTCQNLATACTGCKGLATLVSGHCYLCNDGQYLSGTTCVSCIQNCQTCSSVTCGTCLESFYYKTLTNECLSVCDDGYFGNTTTRTCDVCNSACLTCVGGTYQDCLSCGSKVLNIQNVVSGECQVSCLLGYYKQNDGCAKCWKGCSSCLDGTAACLVCANKFYRLRTDENCYEQCPDGYYNNPVGSICSPCNANCKTCNSFSEINCLSCATPLAFYENQCLKDCIDGYGNINNICTKCSLNCKSCFGVLPNECLSCTVGYYYLNNQCYTKCPTFFNGLRPQYICKCIYDNCVTCSNDQFFLNNACYNTCPAGHFGYNGLCIKCDISCQKCFGEGINECISCSNGLFLYQNQCITNCSGNLYEDNSSNECKECEQSCLACTGPNENNCTACFDGKLLSLNGKCQDNCSEGEYPVISEKKCYDCHSSCVTCFGSSYKNCLTCPSGQFVYLFECVASCPDGFIISSNGVNCDPNTAIVIAQCAYQCETCELTARFCKKCAANRSSNAPNCDCESGYFDDGVNSLCPPCANKCQTCTGVATHCLKCKGDRLLPNCECPQYYYDDGESVNCTKCQDNCETCNSNGCITCLADRLNPPLCQCPDGYFEAFVHYCQECAKKCTKCSGSALLCETCSGIRVSPPICGCPSGYFDNSDQECQQCDATCKDCDIFGCLSCAANRVGPIEGECRCDVHGISRYSIGQVYCTDCLVGVPYFGLNEDFTGFYFEFGGQVQIVQTETEDLCQAFFSAETLAQLGTDPVCDQDLNVIFGEEPNLKVGDMLQLNPIFMLQECSTQYIKVLPNQLSIPSSIDQASHLPSVRFKDIQEINICEEIKIEFDEIFFNGGQNLKILEWSQQLPVQVNPQIQALLIQATESGSNFLIIAPKLFEPEVFYKITVKFESFAKLQNSASIQMKGNLKSSVKFEITSQKNQFFRFQNLSLLSLITYSNCIESDPPEQSLYFEVVIKRDNFQILNGTIQEGLVDGFNSSPPPLEFFPYYFKFENPYTLLLKTKLTRPDYSLTTQSIFDIYIIPSAPELKILGGNRMVGYTEDLYLNTTIKDPDLTEEEAMEVDYQCYWSCQDIINGTACQNQANQTIQFDNKCNQVIPGKSFAPYQVFNFEMFVEKQSNIYSIKVSIQMIEIDLPALIVEGPNQNQTHNYYDEFVYKLIYSGINPDILMYAGAVIYDQVVQATIQFYYLEFKFKIQNYFTNFISEKGNIGRLRLSIYDPRFIMPSLNTQMLIYNIPPNSCKLDFNYDEGVIEFIEILKINILNCKDESSPLIYSIMLFPNSSIYQSDLEQSNLYHYLLIAPPQENSNFSFALPFLNKENSLLIFNIQDSQEGIFNITKSITIREFKNITEQDFRTYQQKLISLDDILIGYNLITERLNSITELWEYKEELLQELIQLDQNQSFLSNQTETLYHCVSNLLSQNVSLIQNNESIILQQLNYRIELAKEKLIYFTDLQKNNSLTSIQNVDKSDYVKQYYTFTNILSSYINYRVAQNVSATEIQDQLSAMVNYLQNISLPNEPMYKVQSNSVNMNFGFLTTKMAGEIAGATVKDDTPQRLRLLESQADSNSQQQNSSTSFFKFSQTRFIDNPFYASDKFPKNSSGYQAVDPKMINVNSSTNSNNLSSAMKFKFPITKPLPANTSTKCVTQVDSGDWNADICKSVQKNGETVCECNSINPTSIMESLDYLMDKAAEVYSLDTLLAFASFPFYKTIIFYFYLLITGGYAYIVYWGMKVDHIMFEKIAVEKEIQEAEQKLKEEQEKLKKENEDKMGEENKVEKPESQNFIESSPIEQNQVKASGLIVRVFDRPEEDFRVNFKNEDNEVSDEKIQRLNIARKTIFTRKNTAQIPITPEKNVENVPLQLENEQNALINQFKFQTEGQIENDRMSGILISPKIKEQEIQITQKDQALEEEQEQQPKSFKDQVIKQTISKIKAYIEYLKYFHQILSIVYKDDENKPRGLRASIIYTSIMGSLAVLFVFGQIDNITLTLTLAMITAPLNKIYQILLEKTLSSTKKPVRIFGAIIMIVSAAGISYTMLTGLVLSGSVETANQWSYVFIGTFSLDNVFYSPVQLVFQYGIHLGLINLPQVQKFLTKLLDQKAKEFLENLISRRR